MNKARRVRKFDNHVEAGGHSVYDHNRVEDLRHPLTEEQRAAGTKPHYLPVNCVKCRMPTTTGFKVEAARQRLSRPTLPKGWAYKLPVRRRKSRTQGGAHEKKTG